MIIDYPYDIFCVSSDFPFDLVLYKESQNVCCLYTFLPCLTHSNRAIIHSVSVSLREPACPSMSWLVTPAAEVEEEEAPYTFLPCLYSFQFCLSFNWCFIQPARQCLPFLVSVSDTSWGAGVCNCACVIVCLCLCFIEPACPSMFRLVTPAVEEGEEVAPRLWAKCGSSRPLFNPVPATTIYTFTQTPLPRQLLHCRIYNIHFYTAATSKALHFSATMMGRTLACNS